MTKRIVKISGFGLMVFGALVFFLPTKKQFNNTVMVNCPSAAITRLMTYEEKWNKWWPGNKTPDGSYDFNGTNYKIQTILMNGFTAIGSNKTGSYFVDIQFSSGPNATTQLFITSTLQFSSNPFFRLLQYIKALRYRKSYVEILDAISKSFNDVKKVYGFKILEQRVPNDIHIAIKKSLNHYPTTIDIYNLVDELQNYVVTNNAHIVNAPIMNIYSSDNQEWQLMIALATDRELPSDKKYLLKKMVLGKIIVGECKGPQVIVDSLQEQVELFVKDYGKSSPAIHFQRLITDRRTTDSTQWMTTVNIPVFDRSFF